MLPYFILALCMGVGVFCLSFLIKNHILLFFTQLMAGSFFYLCANYLLGSKIFREVIEIIKSKTLSVG
jgi:hypothetical protein